MFFSVPKKDEVFICFQFDGKNKSSNLLLTIKFGSSKEQSLYHIYALLARVFYSVKIKNGSSFITSKSLSENLSNLK